MYGFGLLNPPKAKHVHDKLAWYHYFKVPLYAAVHGLFFRVKMVGWALA
jgi:hypothetical protein